VDPLTGHMHTHAGFPAQIGWRPSDRPTPMDFMAALAAEPVAELGELAQYPTAVAAIGRDRRPAAADSYVLDDRLEPVPPGMPGELYLGGQGLGRGLWAAPAMTALCFIADPHALSPGSRLYRTGYIARLTEGGEIAIVGSTARRIRIHGVPVMPEEVEAMLTGHLDVADCAVTTRADNGVPELAAYIVAAPGRNPDPGELRRYLSARVPDVMVPARFKLLGEVTMTAGGTPDWAALPEFDASAPRAAVAPQTPIEQMVADMAAEILGTDRVDMSSNFLELGGHSLMAVQLVIWAREEFDVELPLRLLYEATLADLAEFVFDELSKADSAAGRQ
jgi:acyl carrier protein